MIQPANSTLSRAALYVGNAQGTVPGDGESGHLIEAEAGPGVIASPLSKYARFNTRICRPMGLSVEDRDKVIKFTLARIGMRYDSKRVPDLARFLLPLPPVPIVLRRRLLAVGSGDPTRAICSSLIGEAFASVGYPIMPESTTPRAGVHSIAPYLEEENRHIRKHGLYTPRDFDVSPFFDVIKPALRGEFGYPAAE